MKILFYFLTFIFGLYGLLIVLHTIGLWATGGGFLPVALMLGIVTLLLAGACFHTRECGLTIQAHRILGTLWMAVCGSSGIPLLWSLLRDAILFPKIFFISSYLYLPTLLCLLYLAGAVAGIFLFRGAWWARWFVGMIAVMTFIVTTAMIVKQGPIAQLYYIVSFFEIVSVSAIILPRYEPVA